MTFVVTCAFLLSILWTMCYPLIKSMISFRMKLKVGTHMVVQIIELIEYSDAERGHLDPVIWVKCFLKDHFCLLQLGSDFHGLFSWFCMVLSVVVI